jgi:hypothetical protein
MEEGQGPEVRVGRDRGYGGSGGRAKGAGVGGGGKEVKGGGGEGEGKWRVPITHLRRQVRRFSRLHHSADRRRLMPPLEIG